MMDNVYNDIALLLSKKVKNIRTKQRWCKVMKVRAYKGDNLNLVCIYIYNAFTWMLTLRRLDIFGSYADLLPKHSLSRQIASGSST